MKLTILGSAGGVPTRDNANSAFLLETPSTHLLIDFGHGAMGPLRTQIDPVELDAVVLTHLHADHCADMAALLVYLRYDPRWRGRPEVQPVLPVHGPAETLERLACAYAPSAAARSAEDLSDVFAFTPLRDRASFTIGSLTVTPISVNHSVETYGVRVEDGAEVFAFTGDTGPCAELDHLAADAGLLLCEANWEHSPDRLRDTHLSGREAGELATRAGARQLVLTHVPSWRNEEAILAEARHAYDGPVELARAGAAYHVPLAAHGVAGAGR